MQYSFFPIQAVNTIHDHTGLVFILLVCLCVLAGCLWVLDGDAFKSAVAALVAVCLMSVQVSFNSGREITYKNEPVNAKFVEFIGESQRTGKATHHRTYVVYLVDGQRVMFESKLGVQYPPVAVLYRN